MTRHTRMRQVKKLPYASHLKFGNMTIERAKDFYTFTGDLDPTFIWKRMYTIRIGTHHDKINYRHKIKSTKIRPVIMENTIVTLYDVTRNYAGFKHDGGFLQLIGK